MQHKYKRPEMNLVFKRNSCWYGAHTKSCANISWAKLIFEKANCKTANFALIYPNFYSIWIRTWQCLSKSTKNINSIKPRVHFDDSIRFKRNKFVNKTERKEFN